MTLKHDMLYMAKLLPYTVMNLIAIFIAMFVAAWAIAAIFVIVEYLTN